MQSCNVLEDGKPCELCDADKVSRCCLVIASLRREQFAAWKASVGIH